MLLTLYSIIRTTMAEQVMSGGTLPCHITMAVLPCKDDADSSQFHSRFCLFLFCHRPCPGFLSTGWSLSEA